MTENSSSEQGHYLFINLMKLKNICLLYWESASSCSFGLVWLINRTFSVNKQYFSLTLNQPIVLLVMTYPSNEPKRTWRIFLVHVVVHLHVHVHRTSQ